MTYSIDQLTRSLFNTPTRIDCKADLPVACLKKKKKIVFNVRCDSPWIIGLPESASLSSSSSHLTLAPTWFLPHSHLRRRRISSRIHPDRINTNAKVGAEIVVFVAGARHTSKGNGFGKVCIGG